MTAHQDPSAVTPPGTTSHHLLTTETTLPSTGTGHSAKADSPSTSAPQVFGADLARIALRRARADAKNGPLSKPKPFPRWAARGDGRDPNPLGGILKQLVVDNQWERGHAGGTLKTEWPRLVGETRAAHWKADRFDETTGILRVMCDTGAWAATLRLMAPQVIAEINQKLNGTPLRGLDVRTYTGRTDQLPTDAAHTAPAEPQPVLSTMRAVEPSSEYRTQRERLRQAATQRAADAPHPLVLDSEHRPLREPADAFTEGTPAPLTPQATRAAQAAATRARALARARAERSQRATGPATHTYLFAS
ncbi:DUF721 domain-containing protein [Streptomyces abikoensis]|uniref:DUF721 domain-containing protein n=1 Tax=Streptomyces abikoensis TaxID=97398 RepID=UPI0033D04332